MLRNSLISLLACVVCLFSCNADKKNKKDTENIGEELSGEASLEKYRPVFHFTPPENWINDPNGLVYHEGEYHLFYQYNPFGDTWGHMSWGHAVSNDLLTWEHLPVALYEEDGIMIFSGSAVVDQGNTSGLCTHDQGCLMAIYTSHIGDKAQHQSIAYSQDKGRTWEKYQNNPVLDIGKKDFRDPKVFWYTPEEKWIMVVSLPLEHKVQFYQSHNLTDWELTGEFGNQGDVSKIWECPDLLQVPVEGSGEKKWVLIISSGSKYGDFTGMQYFVGSFDGKKFVTDQIHTEPQWIDHGKDFYAAITFNHLPEGAKPVLIGWGNNWRYANSLPTAPWRGMMSVPRELTLRKASDEFSLIQSPVSSLDQWLAEFKKISHKDQIIKVDDQLLEDIRTDAFRLAMVIENIDAEIIGIEVLKTEGESTLIGYSIPEKTLFLNREQSGNVDFHEDFASEESAALELSGNRLSLDILVDRSMVEVFANDGYRVITDQVFPEGGQNGLKLYVKNGTAKLVHLELIKIH
jgi:fructan beta-fructosidase